MLPLAAYADRLSVRPGETISFQVANATGKAVSARVVRVISADANPVGPGIQFEELDTRIDAATNPGPASVPRGSYAIVDGLDGSLSGASFTFACRTYPTRLDAGRQSLIARVDREARRGFALMIDGDGRLRGCMGNGDGFEEVEIEEKLVERSWYTVWLCFDAEVRASHRLRAFLHHGDPRRRHPARRIGIARGERTFAHGGRRLPCSLRPFQRQARAAGALRTRTSARRAGNAPPRRNARRRARFSCSCQT